MKIIVLDTNIWLSELALMTPLGCAFSHYITVSGFKIGLPEVIEEEAKYNFRKNLLEYRSNIESDYKRMLAIFGKMKELVMPSDDEIERKVAAIFDFHKDRTIRLPFTIESARSSFEKIIKKEPPNSEKNQQFKDGVIWANCLESATSGEVLFVTEDKAFFKDRNYDKGLAGNLLGEANRAPNKILIFHELAELLNEIKSPVTLNEEQLLKLIEKEMYDNMLKLCERNEFNIAKLSHKTFEVFATTNPKEVSVKFSLKYDLENKSAAYRVQPYAESKGEFLLDIENYMIRNFINRGEYLFWRNKDGELEETRNTYAYGNIVLGHRTIEHQITYKLGET